MEETPGFGSQLALEFAWGVFSPVKPIVAHEHLGAWIARGSLWGG